MRAIITLLILFSVKIISAQTTIFSENMGTPIATTAITSNVFQNNSLLSYSNGAQPSSADVRSTSVSSSYFGSSAGGNVFFTSTSGTHGFSIEGINSSNYNTLSLQFGYKKESSTTHASFTVEYWNGNTWVTLANTTSALYNESANAPAVWYLSKVLPLPVDAQINDLKIRFIKAGTVAIRIDDVKLTGSEILPSVLNNPVTNVTDVSATFIGKVTALGGFSIIETGTIFSATSSNNNPLINGNDVNKIIATSVNPETGEFFNSTGNTLLSNVQYSYNSYVIRSSGSIGYDVLRSFYSLATVPAAPEVSNSSPTTVTLAIGDDTNSELTTYAVFESMTGNYVQVNGSLGNTPVYLTATEWGLKTITNLQPSTNYSFKTIAKNGDGISTAFGPSSSIITLTSPMLITTGTLTSLSTVYGSASLFSTFSLEGSNLTDAISILAPTGYEISISADGTTGYSNSLTINPNSGSISLTTVYVKLSSSSPFGTYGGNIQIQSPTDNLLVTVPTNTGMISKKQLTITDISILNKVYDGTTTASIIGVFELEGVIGQDVDNVQLNSDLIAANFINAAVGNNKEVIVTGFTLEGISSVNYELIQPFDLTANITNNSNQSDFKLNGDSPTNENSNINYLTYRGEQLSNTGFGVNGSIGVMGFYLRDGGDSPDIDSLSTELKSITFQITNSHLIKAARLFVGTSPRGEVVMVNGQSSITFNNLSEIVAVDDDQLAINLRVTFNDIVTDNEQFIFVITDATADAAGSQFAASDGGGINSVSDGDINKIEVTGQYVNFIQQPPFDVGINSVMLPFPSIKLVDENENIDLDFNQLIMLSSTGTTLLNAYSPNLFTNGEYIFNNIIHTETGADFRLKVGFMNSTTTINSTVFSITSTGLPIFSSIDPICYNGSFTLPTTSINGITGTWSPAINNLETTLYTFTPDQGQNALETTMTVEVVPNILPLFTLVAPNYIGTTLSPLPLTSNNGIGGSWTPELNSNQTTTYTFTPYSNFCATPTNLTISLYDSSVVIPVFNQIDPICVDGILSPLPTTSLNGINGTWSPDINTTTTTTYTFTPLAGQNAVSTVLTIPVQPLIEPTFNPIAPIAYNSNISEVLLPLTSTNGIIGSWSPSLNNKVTTTYIFTPNDGQCAKAVSLTIAVQQPAIVPIVPQEDIVTTNPDGSTTVLEASLSLTDTKGELSVSSSGTPIYKIPIALPPGIKNVAPQLALEYSGSSVQGIAGMGWNLNGISSIMRVSSRLDLDGVIDPVDFDTTDRFMLDGQRLIAVGGSYGAQGTTYVTENYSNLKIEALGSFGTIIGSSSYGPRAFIVTFPDGSQAFYGDTFDSKGLTEWKINRWIDPQGNFINYSYFTENNVTLITKITWGKNKSVNTSHENVIDFFYKNRLRAEYSYVKGIEIASRKILSHVSVKTGGQLFRTYTIGHENLSANYQRVKYILESAGDNSISNPIYFDYNTTPNSLGEFTQSSSITGSEIDEIESSGDFDGNGSVDFIANDKVYLNPIDSGNNWYGINITSGERYIPLTTTSNGKLNQFQSVLVVNETSNFNTYSILNYNKITNQMVLGSSVNWGGLNIHFQYCRTNSNFNSNAAYSTCPNSNFEDNKKIKSTFLEGDYDGNGITDLIHIRPIVKRTVHPDFSFVRNYKADEYRTFFYNASFPNISEQTSLAILGGKANYTADFNGDGRSDILSVNKETDNYTVYQYNMLNNQLEALFTGMFTEKIMSGDNVKQLVFGDFNGDSKMDIMIPVQNGSTSWVLRLSTGVSFKYDLYSNFELYQPHWQGSPTANRKRIRTYRAADLNKDGKSDFISNEWESWSEGINNRDSRAYFRYKENIGSLNSKPTFALNQEKKISSRYRDPITCLVGDFKNPQANFEFTFIQKSTIWKGQYDKDIELEATLTRVKEIDNKIFTDISYKSLQPSSGLGSVNDVYSSTNTEMYPYTEMISIPSMKVVDKVTVYYGGLSQFKSQLYKYSGLVVHSTGFGVLGFKKIARSSWFNASNPNKIWSCVLTSPQLLGQTTHEWSYSGDNHMNFANPPTANSGSDNLSLTTNTYTSNLLGNGVRIIVPNKSVKKDFLTGLTNQTEYFYNSYWNVYRTLFTNSEGTKETLNEFYDNPSGTGKQYAIGRLTQTNENIVNYNDTYTTEVKYDYHPNQPNLVKQTQKKGHNTDYVTENYEYDVFGNVIKKTSSAPNVSTRIIKSKYDANGRFVIEKTDVDGLVSKLEYNRLGQVIKSIDPFNVATITNYDNWGFIKDITTIGVSTSPKKSTIGYYRDDSGNFITSTTNLATNEVNRVFVNRLGQQFKTTTKGFGANTWISKVVEYDFLGRKKRESEPYMDSNPTNSITAGTKWNIITYDNLSRPILQEGFNGRNQTIVYDGLKITTTDGPKTTEVTYDANGNKRIVKDNNETLTFNYFANGLQKETLYGNHTLSYAYDGWGRNVYMKDPSVSDIPYTNTYNNYGELLTATTPTGTSTMTYSPIGRLMQKTSVGQNTNMTSSYAYDAKGLLMSETGTSNSKSFTYTNTYNSLYQLVSKKEVTPDNYTHSKSFEYDGQGRILRDQSNSFMTNNPSVNNGNITIEFGYNAYNGILEQYKDVATSAVLWKLNSANERMQALTATLGNGMQITNTYDADYYFRNINHASTTNTALNLEYNFVRDRGILSKRKNTIAGVLFWDETFSYDNFERLTSWTDPTGTSSNTYETDGRITDNTAVGSYNYGGGSRYRRTTADLNAQGEAHYLTRTPQTISYNMFKSPINITEVTRGSVAFEYNMSGDRTKSTQLAEDGTTVVKNKFYSGISEIEVIEKPNQTLQFITYLAGSPYSAAVVLEKSYTANNGSYTANPEEFLYLHRDYQGTILAISGTNGAIKERRIFDPWGNLKKKYIGNTAVADASLGLVDFELLTDRGYTGHEHFFSVGIIHMNGRLYDPVLRSFLSADPLLQDQNNSQNYNRYAYCFNNPLLYTDPSGNFIVESAVVSSIIIGAIIGGVVYIGMAFYTGTFSWGGLAKSIVVGAVSGAASAGVGSVVNSLTNSICSATQTLTLTQIKLMLAIPQAVMHGVAQGFIQGVSGGSFEQSFLTAAISSVVAGGYGMAAGDSAKKAVGQVLFGTFAGGITAELSGGNFWQGAATGFVVSLLNHAMHDGFAKKYKFNVMLDEKGARDFGHHAISGELDNGDYRFISKNGTLDPNDANYSGESDFTDKVFSSVDDIQEYYGTKITPGHSFNKIDTYLMTRNQMNRAFEYGLSVAKQYYHLLTNSCTNVVSAALYGAYNNSTFFGMRFIVHDPTPIINHVLQRGIHYKHYSYSNKF